MRLLVVEDDAKIASSVIKGLEQSGFAVDHASNGEDGLFMAQTEPYDAAIIDVMLPSVDGLSIIAEMREDKLPTPVIILSAKRSVEDRGRDLQIGSDDYIVKPFTFAELLARVQALIRRSTQTTEPACLTVGELSIDLIQREVVRAGQKIELQPREYSLLEYLMRQAGRVVSKAMIMEHIWDYHFDPQANVVDVLVCRLRNKVGKDFRLKLIHTIRGVGYVIKIT
jgi:two-component system, OmpR family, response regulator